MAGLFTLLLSQLSMTFRWSLIVWDGPILICDHHFLRSSAEVRGSQIPAKDWYSWIELLERADRAVPSFVVSMPCCLAGLCLLGYLSVAFWPPRASIHFQGSRPFEGIVRHQLVVLGQIKLWVQQPVGVILLRINWWLRRRPSRFCGKTPSQFSFWLKNPLKISCFPIW